MDDIESRVRQFVAKLEFTEEDIRSYAEEFHIAEATMRKMAARISRELKHDLEEVLKI